MVHVVIHILQLSASNRNGKVQCVIRYCEPSVVGKVLVHHLVSGRAVEVDVEH